jgi:hypothetical protein
MRHLIARLAAEPPFRIIARAALRAARPSSATRARWDLSPRPAYLLGLVAAAAQARRQKFAEIAAIEFGVAGGVGLLAMQREAEAVERDTGIGIRVYGLDMGPEGLPAFVGDFRDHPEEWRPGDYPMQVERLLPRLTQRTSLILGNIEETATDFFEKHRPPPIGFVAVDVDLYSSTRAALRIFQSAARRMLWHTPMYFDDIGFIFNHRFAGELLAIDEFNRQSAQVKIDRWYGVRYGRPFPERPYLEQMYVAHDIAATSGIEIERKRGALALPA